MIYSDASPTPAAALEFPPALTDLDQFVLWRRFNGRKVCFQRTGSAASSTDPETWCGFDAAVGAWLRFPDHWDGIGFVFHPDDPFCGIDLDDCLTDAGELKAWAVPIVERLSDTYTEISPSGCGLKAWVRARLSAPCSFALGDGKVEFWDRARYFCVTGRRWRGAPLEIEDGQSTVTWLQSLSPRKDRRVPQNIGGPIPHHHRHDTLVSIGGTLARRGVAANELAALFLEMRKRFEGPPVPDRNLIALAEDLIRRYAE